MARIQLQTAQEVERSFAQLPKRAVREEEMRPYREAAEQLSGEKPGGVIDLEEGENPRLVMMRMHRAARDQGKYLRFQRQGRNGGQLRFRLQTPDETARLKERGAMLAQARQNRSRAGQTRSRRRRAT